MRRFSISFSVSFSSAPIAPLSSATRLMSVRRLDVEGQHLECREIGILQVREPGRALFSESSHDIAGENQKAAPRDQQHERILCQPGVHAQPLGRLKEEDEGRDE